ncbi:MAG: hypothetical protein J2P44_13005 [Candidatus Dormibacteraeota bacterium]|nr:hypothetical protein [Candidatus Dormibacteraeota bacterium]
MAWESCSELGRARIPLAGAAQTVTGTAIERNRETREVRFRPAGRAAPTEPGPDEPFAEPESFVIPEDQFQPL